MWVLTGRRHLPSAIALEPIDLLDDVLDIDGYAHLIEDDAGADALWEDAERFVNG